MVRPKALEIRSTCADCRGGWGIFCTGGGGGDVLHSDELLPSNYGFVVKLQQYLLTCEFQPLSVSMRPPCRAVFMHLASVRTA